MMRPGFFLAFISMQYGAYALTGKALQFASNLFGLPNFWAIFDVAA
jgi:hypothetical protein